jgi:WD40 repeat protein
MRKEVLLAPITALDIKVKDNSTFSIFSGSGGEIRGHDNNQQKTKTIFDFHSVNGIRVIDRKGIIVAFGDKAVTLLSLDGLEVLNSMAPLCDMVLDCCIMDRVDSHENIFFDLLVGFAHNFVDVLEIKGDQHHFLRRVVAPEACVLFSLNFSACHVTEGEPLTLASGNVFGKVILWDFPPPADAGAGKEEGRSQKAGAKITLTSHEGVIFRTRWSPDGKFVATVADDRTVRVYNIESDYCRGEGDTHNREVFVGWGHISRVWDVVFLQPEGPLGSMYVASASEDATIKIWDFANNKSVALASLRGHSGDIWRLAACGRYLLSGGNDGAVKVWDILDQLKGCPDEVSSTITSFQFGTSAVEGGVGVGTEEPAVAAVIRNSSRRTNGTSGLRISPDSRYVVVVLCSGAVWMVDTQHVGSNRSSSSQSLGRWASVTQLDSTVIAMEARWFDSDRGNAKSKESMSCQLACSHPDGSVSYLSLNNEKVQGQGQWGVGQYLCWKAHPHRCTGIYLVGGHDEHLAAGGTLIVSASIQGSFTIWQVPAANNNNTSDPVPLLQGRTGNGKRRGEMVAAACYLREGVLVLGDIKGGVSVYELARRKGQEQEEAHQHLPHMHGAESVSCFASSQGGGFLSGGADGALVRYTPVINAGVGAGALYERAGSVSCLPVRLPLQIITTSSVTATTAAQGPSLLVGGFHANLYLVVDLALGATHLRVEAGSWRRPHHCLITTQKGEGSSTNIMPHAYFLSVAPLGNTDSVINECRSHTEGNEAMAVTTTLLSSSMREMSVSHNGRVNYGGTFIGTDKICVGGEEGKIRVYRCSSGSGSHSETVNFIEELSLRGSAPVKAMTSVAGHGLRVLVGAGSRMCFSVWTYLEGGEGRGGDSSGLSTLRHEGCAWEKATQEHRILCAASASCPAKNTFLALLCDSRGTVTPVAVPETAAKTVQVLPSFQPSTSPILCCDLIPLNSRTSTSVSASGEEILFLGAFGSSSGAVSLWAITYNSSELHAKKLLECAAHAMGANCLSAKAWKEDGDGEFSWRVVVVSGGDDQSMSLISATVTKNSCLSNRMVRAESAGGAAIKGLCVRGEGGASSSFEAVTLAADQRVQCWSIELPVTPPDGADNSSNITTTTTTNNNNSSSSRSALSPFEAGSPFKWRAGTVSNIGDPQYMAMSEDGARVLVAGEGVQTVAW